MNYIMATFFLFLFLITIVILAVGLIKPAIVIRWGIKRDRKQVLLYYGLSAVAFFILIGIFAPPVDTKKKQADNSNNTKEYEAHATASSSLSTTTLNGTINESVNQDSQNNSSEIITTPNNTPATLVENSNVESYKVVSVVDGDTIKVVINGKTETLRLIGIDTPETVDPRKPVQCFGKEASNKAKEWLSGKEVELEAETSQGDRDKYNRLLRYVRVKGGIFYNLEIIKQGYAHEYTYGVPYKYQADFKNAEKYARDNKLGLWADNTCAGDTTKAATASVSAPIAPIAVPTTNNPTDTSKCTIKGNVTTEKIYHLPGCGSYDKTVIDESAGERWFCTEADAIAAGWRKAKNCP